MKYYPLNLELKNKKCVVVGAGLVASRKVKRLLECGARVLVIGQDISLGLKILHNRKKIILKNKKADLSDLNKAFLVVAATNDRALNSLISAHCLKNNILVNVVDSPKECNFILPAVLRKGNLVISVSTEGISPALAKKIRLDLEKKFGAKYAKFLRQTKKLRLKAIKEIKDPVERRAFLKKLVDKI